VDPWKRQYIYLAPGMTGKPYELISYGADGEPGGDRYNTDISCWDM
jgi:general secretion pathway protein G